MQKAPVKRRTIYVIYAIFLVGCILYGYASASKESLTKKSAEHAATTQSDSVGIYSVKITPDLDLVTYETSISLDHDKKVQYLLFPNGGTQTDVFIYTPKDSISADEKPMPLALGGGATGEKILVDISGLPEGEYTVHYLSCGNGGLFQLTLQ